MEREESDKQERAHAAFGVPVQELRLNAPGAQKRLPEELVREAQAAPPGRWLLLRDACLDRLPYAADLARRLGGVRRGWIGEASLGIVERPALLEVFGENYCRALLVDGREVSERYLSTVASSDPDAPAGLAAKLRLVPEHGIFSVVRFVFGLDTDDEGVFERTLRFCRRAAIGLPLFSILTPDRGSELFSSLEREGRILHRDWAAYDGNRVVFQPRLMTPETLQNGFNWSRRKWFGHAAIWGRSLLAGPSAALSHLGIGYQHRRVACREPAGSYTDTMRLLGRFARPVRVRERAGFVSTLRGAVAETRRHLHGARLRTQAIRDERLQALTVRVEGVLDLSGATELLQRIRQAVLTGHRKVVVDLRSLEAVSHAVITRFLEENAQTLLALRDRVVFRDLRSTLEGLRANLGGVPPNAHLLELAPEER